MYTMVHSVFSILRININNLFEDYIWIIRAAMVHTVPINIYTEANHMTNLELKYDINTSWHSGGNL